MAESSSIDVKLKRIDRVYRLDELVEGTIIVYAKSSWSHKGITLTADGTVYLCSGRGIGIVNEPGSGRPQLIFKHESEVTAPGRFAEGFTEIPFEFPISSVEGHALLESYHGVYVSVIYNIRVECERGMLKKCLAKDMEFVVEVPSAKSSAVDPQTFDITPESLEIDKNVVSTIPKFRISGRLHKSVYAINQPFTGELTIHSSEAPIRSLELQLVRVETTVLDGRTSREATEVQNLQIGDGNVCRDLCIPMHMVFPRLFSCPTVLSSTFKIEFEVKQLLKCDEFISRRAIFIGESNRHIRCGTEPLAFEALLFLATIVSGLIGMPGLRED